MCVYWELPSGDQTLLAGNSALVQLYYNLVQGCSHIQYKFRHSLGMSKPGIFDHQSVSPLQLQCSRRLPKCVFNKKCLLMMWVTFQFLGNVFDVILFCGLYLRDNDNNQYLSVYNIIYPYIYTTNIIIKYSQY